MESELKKFKKENINRIAQLINKTNQFNLTVKRFNLKEVVSMSKNSNFFTISGNLKDKFGDNGLVTVLVGKITKDRVDVILWLMSCRVFNRNLEFAVFDNLVKYCKNKKILKIYGYYNKDKKNFIVENFYRDLGFKKIYGKKSASKWEYKIMKKYVNKNKIIKIYSEK